MRSPGRPSAPSGADAAKARADGGASLGPGRGARTSPRARRRRDGDHDPRSFPRAGRRGHRLDSRRASPRTSATSPSSSRTAPSAELLAEMEIEPPDTLLGLYQGTPLTERRWDHGNALPDRVLLFQRPIEEDAEDRRRRRRRHRRDAHPRARPLLRPERGRDHGHRGALLARRARARRRRAARRDARPQAFRPALPRAGLAGQGARPPAPSRRATPCVEIGPGRGALTIAAGRAGGARAGRRARSRPGRGAGGAAPAAPAGGQRRLPAAGLGRPRWPPGERPTRRAGPRGRQPPLQRLVADPLPAARGGGDPSRADATRR